MIQLQAGYVFDCVKDTLLKYYQKETVEGLLKQLSFFNIEIDAIPGNSDNSDFEQTLSVAYNLISRGLPTRASFWVENTILQSNKYTQENSKELDKGSIKRDFTEDDEIVASLFRSLHIIEPALRGNAITKKKIKSWENLEDPFEEDFLYNQIPKYLSEYWIQLFDSQRELEHLLQFSTKTEDEIEKYLNGTVQIANKQKIDFVIEYPYLINESRGIIVEIDGPQHDHPNQIYINSNRDTATENAKFGRALRIKTSKWDNIKETISWMGYVERYPYFQTLKQNFDNPLYLSNEGLCALEMVLMPFAIARLQKTIIHLLLNGNLDINADEWNIAVLERDIPCAEIAFEDLKQQLEALLGLQGNTSKSLPKINLYVKSDSRFEKSQFVSQNEINEEKTYDLLIDISVFQRSGFTESDPALNANTKVSIRSSHSPNTYVSFSTTESIKYKALGQHNKTLSIFEEDKTQVNLLKKFLQDIFRKTAFKAGQIEIINRALQGKSVIGLLPAASGKSLAYQLTALLQPGIAVIVDPTKSLMTDQYENLLKDGISCAVYIHSSLRRKERRKALEKIKKAHALFVFVTPEKLQEDSFRKELLTTSQSNQNYFSYCIIDEAHCVSEWGHDFRTSYTCLGDNVRKYCKTKSNNDIPLLALTASASYNVLSDIQRDLAVKEDALIRVEKPDQPETFFKIIEVNADLDLNADINPSNKDILGEAKLEKLIQEIKLLTQNYKAIHKNEDTSTKLLDFNPEYFNSQQNAGLIFGAHRNSYPYISDISTALKYHFPDFNIGITYKNEEIENKDKIYDYNQAPDENNQLELLIATKDCGIGINKENIRVVIHLNYPDSIERYYQEIGRAGRDGNSSMAILLFNKQYFTVNEEDEIVSENGVITRIIKKHPASIDKELLLNLHKKNFKGIQKEQNLIAELLSEIKYPSRKIMNYIEGRVLEEFSTEVHLNTVTENNRLALYVNPNYATIYLDRANLPLQFARSPLAVKIADYIKQIILIEKPEEITPVDWLNQYIHSSFSAPGIEAILQNNDAPDDTFQVIVPFTNNILEEIIECLNDNGLAFTYRIVHEAQNECNDKSKFIESLEWKYKSIKDKVIHIPDNLKQSLQELFSEIRNEHDTLKAIYRLSIIGVIDDYTVDHNSKIITVTASQKNQGYYTNKLKEFILQYNSSENTNEKIKQLSLYKGNSEIQKCVSFLLEFIYEEVAPQHKTAIESMEEACKIGLQKNGSHKFKEFVDLYMNSKYAQPSYLPADTHDGLNADFGIVEKYMDLVRTQHGQINNLKHLKNTTTRLSTQYPENFVFILLKSFSVFLTEKERNDFIENAQADFIEGFIKEHESTNENAIGLKKKMDIFREKIRKLDNSPLEKVEEAENIVLHSIHTNWLKDFNDNFINI
ncbi:MAG: DEAD/DEAH box helicase [Tannerella sp.]|jgi:ATP-dependent DNA helicase RecQ|nr:DEAD/DEAH box helicase [Tannerella sp.]